MDEQAHVIPRDIERPTEILFFEPLELVIAIALMGFGMVLHLWALGAIAAGATLYGAKYLRRGAKRGAAQHFMWSVGLQVDPYLTKRFPPAWVNEFVE